MLKSKIALLCAAAGFSASSFAFNAKIADTNWDGKKVPEGAQCQRFEGKAVAPRIHLSNIPEGTNIIVLEFSDESSERMNNGGHGKVGYTLRETDIKETIVPSFPGHTFTLPAGFFTVAAHRGPNWDTAGAYMPPCSGGRGNDYSVMVKAVQFDGSNAKVLAEQKVVLGKY